MFTVNRVNLGDDEVYIDITIDTRTPGDSDFSHTLLSYEQEKFEALVLLEKICENRPVIGARFNEEYFEIDIRLKGGLSTYTGSYTQVDVNRLSVQK